MPHFSSVFGHRILCSVICFMKLFKAVRFVGFVQLLEVLSSLFCFAGGDLAGLSPLVT